MLRKSILVISDQHAPYHHIDTIDFLAAIKQKYKPDTVVNIGDEMDWHSISFHDSHPGLYSPCLLYTSPSPRDLSTSRMPSSA